nr:LLM class flavin-dependent oxidoreductase [Actinokineospora sp. NBRC 105648]
MNIGVFLLAPRFPGQDDQTALRRAVDIAHAAERSGLRDLWIAEHHFMPYGTCPDATALAGYLLGATARIAVGTAVSVLSTTHPVALAERARLLAVLSRGRFRLGVGRGGPWVDLEVFGSSVDRYEHGFPETLAVLREALASPTVRGTDRFPFREVPLVPTPEEPPTVHVACTSLRSVELAAREHLPMLLGMHMSDDEKRAFVNHYRRHGGPEHADHISTVVVHVADSREQAVQEVMQAAPGWLRDGLRAHVPVDGRQPPTRDPVAYARLLCDLHPVGDPDYCARRLAQSAERSGVGHLIAMVEATGTTAHALRAVACLGTPPGSDLGKLA